MKEDANKKKRMEAEPLLYNNDFLSLFCQSHIFLPLNPFPLRLTIPVDWFPN